MNKLLILDLDGTVRRPKSGAKFISDPLDQEIIPEAARAIAHYKSQGWLIVGATNQGGVAAGHKQLEDAITEQYQTLRLCPEITCIYFCPDYQGLHCWLCCINPEASSPIHTAWGWEYSGTYRKPGAGMLNAAIKNHLGFKSQEHQILFVGDRDEDKGAAESANVPFLWASDWWKSGDANYDTSKS
ncbi:MAG TPA: HAD-IIIA family hydrolase [Nostoc sp.]|uniref:HAD-IIIA family hydrolase n=1 Tax=Nostoc sp. TaxID=1180 RepID=UPI002D2CE28F|nr:HAD-IIIA family hydrolase [Nostoc sp.]HYX13485.1 HAD-IIIA family hydrolase [Nostoc sp.]